MAIDTAANIVKGVIEKSNGNSTAKTPDVLPGKPVEAPVDPNAGKEKYVVDGQDRWLTPDQARAYVQKGISFEPKIDQLGRLQHETASFLQTLQDDPGRVLYNERFGTPEEVLAKLLKSAKVSDKIKETVGQWYYDHVYVPEQMTPQQREAALWKEKAEAHDQMLRQQAQDRLDYDNQQRVNQALGVLKAQVNEAMKEAGVPIDAKIAPQIARRVAQMMQLGYRAGRVVTPKEAMQMVKNEILDTQKSYYDVLDEDKLVEQLGKENAEKVRKHYLKLAKESDKEKPKKDFKPIARRDERKTMTPDEFHDRLQELKKNG